MQYFQSHKYKEGDCHFKDIQVQQLLGTGNSMVFAVKFKKRPAAMKQIIIKSQQQAAQVSRQIKILKQLSQTDSSIIKYYGSFSTTRDNGVYNFNEITYIVMQRAMMSLQQLIQHRIRSGEIFSEGEIEEIMKTLVNALCILEKLGLAHCDIKPQNILIMDIQSQEIKLCDIGSCRITRQTTEEITLVGTVPFLAPELVKDINKERTLHNPFKSDAFSLGLCLVYLMSFKKFKSNERLKISESVYKEVIMEWVAEAGAVYFKNQILGYLLESLLDFDPKMRMTFSELKESVNKQMLTIKLKKNQLFKEAKTKHQQLFVEKNKKPVIGTFHSVLNTTKRNDARNNSMSFGFRSTFRAITQQASTLKTKRKVVLKKIQIPSTTMISSRKRLSPLSSKRKMSITKNNITMPSIQYSSPIFKQKSTMCEELSDHQGILVRNQNLTFIEENLGDHHPQLIILDRCYLNVERVRELTIRLSEVMDLEVVINNLKDSETVGSLVVDMRGYTSKSKFKFNTFDSYTSITNLSLILDSSSLTHYLNLFSVLIASNIRKLSLSLTNTPISPELIPEFLKTVSKRTELETLFLNMKNLKTTQKQNKSITDQISKLSSLKMLNLNMANSNISFTTQHPWILPKNLQKLIYSYSHNDVRLIINCLSVSLPSIKSTLKQLILDLTETYISTKQVNFLFSSIAKLNLDVLSIQLGHNQLDHSASKYISKTLILLQHLSYLHIGLQNTNIQTQQFLNILTSINKMFSKRLRTVSLAYNRWAPTTQIRDSISKHLKQEVKIFIIQSNITVKIFLKTRQSPLIKKKLTLHKKSSHCLNLHNTGEYKYYTCITCAQNQSTQSLYLCQFCSESCNHQNHSVVPVYGDYSCGCTYLHCRSDINLLPCSTLEGSVHQKVGQCLLCQKEYLCQSCTKTCENQHSHMVVHRPSPGTYKCQGLMRPS